MAREQFSSAEEKSIIEQAESIDPIKERILEYLSDERIGVLSEKDGFWVADTEKMTSESFLQQMTRYKHRNSAKNMEVGLPKDFVITRELLFQKLDDLPVVSKNDYEESTSREEEPKPKPLFSAPESIKEAYKPKQIKDKKGYLDFWELYPKAVNWDFRLQTKKGEPVNTREYFLAVRLFRELEVERDEDGQLKSYDKENDTYEKVTAQWISDHLGENRFGRSLEDNAQQFLFRNCKNLLRSGLLRPEDFRVRTNEPSGELVRKERQLPSDNCYQSLDGAQYYIGRENFLFEGKKYPMENVKVIQLDSQAGGIAIIDGNREKLLGFFDLLTEEKKKVKYEAVAREHPGIEQPASYTRVSRKEMKQSLRPWLRTQDNPKHPGETPEHYAERLGQIRDIDYITQVTRKFAQETGISIHNLGWREQQWLVAATFDLNAQGQGQRLLDFTNNFGLVGLKTFLTCEVDIENGKRILEIGEKMNPVDAMKIFQKNLEIINLAENEKEETSGLLNEPIEDDFNVKVRRKLLEKAHEIILKFSGSTDKDVKKLIDDLEKSKIQIDILSALLKTAKEQGLKLTPENIKDMKMESCEVGELAGEEKAKFREKYEKAVMDMMRKSYAKIFEENPDARAKVEGNFKERFENLEKYRVYVLMFQGEAVAFSVIDPNNIKDCEEGEVMSESTVVHPDVQKGAMGIEFLKKIFETEFAKHKAKGIRGKVRAGHPAGESYDAIGLVIDRSRPTWEENGVEYEWRVARSNQAG